MRLNFLPFTTTHALRLCWSVLFMVLAPTMPVMAQAGGEDPGNQYYRYSNAELEAVCDAMSPTRYVSGLTEGAWFALPGSGKTYYYRSACYMELVRRTGRAELCPKVLERRTLLGDGSSYSPQRCAQVAQAYQAQERQSAQDQAALARAVEGAFKVSQVQVQPLANGNWRLDVQADGRLPGDYVLRLNHLRDGRLLLEETHTLTQRTSWYWELDRATIVGKTPLPNIFPMAVSLNYRPPTTAAGPVPVYPMHIQNFTLSATPSAPSAR